MTDSGTGNYAPVNGLNMYYETHGDAHGGQPLVLLHGAISATETSFGALLPGLASNRRVISIEQQGHGRTADIDRPLTIEQMAEDTAALLRQLNIRGADIFGYSMGAGIALQIGMKHQELVRKLVLVSVSYNKEGFHPGLMEGMADLQPEHLAGSPFQLEYARLAPHPEDWPTLIAKVKQMDHDLQDWPPEAVQLVKAPTLLVIGDSDIIRPEHAVEMFRLLGGGVAGDLAGLPNSRLAILPGTTHVSVVHRAEWLVPMIEDFLDALMSDAR